MKVFRLCSIGSFVSEQNYTGMWGIRYTSGSTEIQLIILAGVLTLLNYRKWPVSLFGKTLWSWFKKKILLGGVFQR